MKIATKPSLTFSNPLDLPTGGLIDRSLLFERNMDILPDGKRFVGVIAADQGQPGAASLPQIQVVEHWFEELKARMSAK